MRSGYPCIHPFTRFITALVVCAALAGSASADALVITPIQDNTLIEDKDGAVSNGAGPSIFAGMVNFLGDFTARRAVVAFDISAIPAGSTINSVTVTLKLEQSNSEDHDMTMHRLTSAWGEGDSSFAGGQGAPAEEDDATWLHTFYPDMLWTNEGGDYDAVASAITAVGSNPIDYNWTSAQLVADVQSWLDVSEPNYGWIFIGDESENQTAKRFASREELDEQKRPRLTVDFTPPVDCAGNTNGDDAVDVFDLLDILDAWGSCSEPCPPRCAADVTGDCSVDVFDLVDIFENWGPCP